MTCRERLKMEYPNKITPGSLGGWYACPMTYGYLERPDYCKDGSNVHGDRCDECWNREIPEEGDLMIFGTHVRPSTKDSGLHYEHRGEPIAKTEKVDISEQGCTVTMRPIIKDSGNRTEFATGAVRDMREGKGRCDLMPLEVVAMFIRECSEEKDWVLQAIRDFQKTNCTANLYSALTAFDEKHWDNCYTMCLEVAKHFEEGAKKYGENNWQKGIPVHCYIDSAIRHYLKWLRGDMDEPHDRAFVWNIMCCIWEVDYRPKEEK